MRELLDGVRYAPAQARYKVYVIDEVHMLSTAAFNALLKTLEEPPPHAKFIFATTEIRKVPVTILSRCQRFDLRRVEPAVIAASLASIAEAEGFTIDAEALALIARAAEGSVRDAQSLLDQALAQAEAGERVDAAAVRDMLGLADRAQTIDLFESRRARRGRPGDRDLPRPLRLRGRPGDRDARPARALPRRLGRQDPGSRRPGAAQGPGRASGGDGRGPVGRGAVATVADAAQRPWRSTRAPPIRPQRWRWP